MVEAIAAANVVSPSGNLMMKGKYPMAPVNSVAQNIRDLEGAPIRGGRYPAVFLRDVAEVEDDSDIVTCYALVNGRRTIYVPVVKRADASALTVAQLVKENVSKFQTVLPPDMKVSYELDRSPVIRQALAGLKWEGGLGAILTGLMIILFLRDWRAALVVVVNIPIALLAAVLALWMGGQTVNIMTLGGLALAVGILVDEGIVCLENIHAHRARGASAARAALDATSETTGPRLLAMLCVLVMFTPALFMTGTIKAMFLPLTLAIGFAMVASYLLSSTLVPVLAVWIMGSRAAPRAGRFARFQGSYSQTLQTLARWRGSLVLAYLAGAGFVLFFIGARLGSEIFPRVESEELQVRLRAPAGTDIDGTEAIFLQTLRIIETTVGAENVEMSLGFVGLHGSSYPINFLYLWNGGTEEGVLQVRLKPGGRRRLEPLQDELRRQFAEQIPATRFSFEPADLVSQVMSLGVALPIEVAVSGPSLANNRMFAEKVKEKLEGIAVLRDVQFAQSFDYPTVEVTVDRERAGIIGPDMTQVSRALVPATWSSRFEAPNFWADPHSGVGYQVQAQIPQQLMNTLESIGDLPVMELHGKAILLRNLARIREGTAMSQYDRYNMQRTITVRANVAGAALSSADRRVRRALAELEEPPPRVSVAWRGQIAPLREMQDGLQRGLIVAVSAIFLLLLAHFQSVKLSLIVVSVVPSVLAGVALALWLTNTTLNIQSFMGTIVSVGIAVANAILLVTFAERSRRTGASAAEAAQEGARSRLRPILMTSAAMIAGMMPVALGLSDKSGQTAPLGCAVVGGLAAATLATLFVLPTVFALGQARSHRRGVSLEELEPHAR